MNNTCGVLSQCLNWSKVVLTLILKFGLDCFPVQAFPHCIYLENYIP